jgi:hypothetical protein
MYKEGQRFYRATADIPLGMEKDMSFICKEAGLSVRGFIALAIGEKIAKYYEEKARNMETRKRLEELSAEAAELAA